MATKGAGTRIAHQTGSASFISPEKNRITKPEETNYEAPKKAHQNSIPILIDGPEPLYG